MHMILLVFHMNSLSFIWFSYEFIDFRMSSLIHLDRHLSSWEDGHLCRKPNMSETQYIGISTYILFHVPPARRAHWKPILLETQFSGNPTYISFNVPPARQAYIGNAVYSKPNMLEATYNGNPTYISFNVPPARTMFNTPDTLETQYTGNAIYWKPNILKAEYMHMYTYIYIYTYM